MRIFATALGKLASLTLRRCHPETRQTRQARLDFGPHQRGLVFAITRRDGDPYFFINGYISIPLSSPSEKYVGAISSMLAPRQDDALVLGVGSGATAATVALSFARTDGIEINRVVLDNLYRMSEYNFDIESDASVEIVHDDGIHFVKTVSKRYSLILNTVTTPLYFSSSKLYTADFFESVESRLTPDGVYVTWIDSRIGDRGIDIILNTLGRVFRNGWLLYIKSGYFLLACSNEELGFHGLDAVASNTKLQEFFAEEYKMPLRLLPYSLISTNVLELRSDVPAPINTLDFPALEFQMARAEAGGFREFGERVSAAYSVERLRDAVAPSLGWDGGENVLHASLRLPEDSKLWEWLSDRSLPPGDWSALDRPALEHARALRSARTYYKFGKLLLDLDRYDAAVESLSGTLELEPSWGRTRYHLGRAHFDREDYEQALENFRAEWNLFRNMEVPLRMGMTLVRLGRFEKALGWLDTAQLVAASNKRKRIAFWRGAAYEGLERYIEAEKYYLEALRLDRDYEDAQQALQRFAGP